MDYFRPKARHIFTIWKDLIKDDFSALIELVKNSYDADANIVKIKFSRFNDDNLLLSITDDWEWMSADDVRFKWIVPSTDSKIDWWKSKNWRSYQGQKGIGRYASSVLGDILELETIKEYEKTTLRVNWNEFNAVDKYLDEIALVIKTEKTSEQSWTKISVIWDKDKADIWSVRQIGRLKKELSQLISPYDNLNDFKIYLDVSEYLDVEEHPEFMDTEIQSLRMEEFFDYKVSWNFIKDLKKAVIKYENADTGEVSEYDLLIDLQNQDSSEDIKSSLPGDFDFELLVIDRDPIKEREQISKTMGNKREISRAKAKKEFDESYGVKLYRWGFRIRPYWESWDDWLNLDSRRVNNPSFRVSNNQIAWFIRIWTEKESGLRELTSRWGLIEDEHFWGMKWVISKILNELEIKKQLYRKKVGLWRNSGNKKLNYNELREDIIKVINKFDHPKKESFTKELSSNLDKIFSQVEEREAYLEKVLFIYERQASLWKIIGELIHEIKQPLSFFKWKLKKLETIIANLEPIFQYNENIAELMDIGVRYKENSLRVLRFLKTIEPLANNNRKNEFVSLHSVIQSSIEALQPLIEENKININFSKNDYQIFWDKTDFVVAFSNFIDNSIYWLSLMESDKDRNIIIDDEVKEWKLFIYIRDNGPGLLRDELKDDIFEPWVTLKEKWTWLWLSIAWEVLKRHNIALSLLDASSGFNLQLIFSQWKI